MLRNIAEFREIPFVKSFLTNRVNISSVKLFSSDLHAFLRDESFRNKFGFDKENYSQNEVVNIIRQIVSGTRCIEYDYGTLEKLNLQKHQFDDHIMNRFEKLD